MNTFIKDNWFKLVIALVIVLIGVSVFYYFVVFIPQKEKIKMEQQKQEQLAKEIKEQAAKEEREQALNTCLASAEESYSSNWYRECKSRGELTSKCISLREMTFDEYAKQNNISQDKRLDAIIDFYKQRDECSCRLPLDNADRINKTLQDDKDECFKKYPQ